MSSRLCKSTLQGVSLSNPRVYERQSCLCPSATQICTILLPDHCRVPDDGSRGCLAGWALIRQGTLLTIGFRV